MKKTGMFFCLLLVFSFLCTSCMGTLKKKEEGSSAHSDKREQLVLNEKNSVLECQHRETEWIFEEIPPTCEKEGRQGRKICKNCGKILEEGGKILPYTGHVYENGECIYCLKKEPRRLDTFQYKDADTVLEGILFSDGTLELKGGGILDRDAQIALEVRFRGAELSKIQVFSGFYSMKQFSFAGFYNLEEILLPYTITEIENSVLVAKKISLPVNLQVLSQNNSLRTEALDLPKNLKRIEKGCKLAVKKLTVPKSLVDWEVIPVETFDERGNRRFLLEKVGFESPFSTNISENTVVFQMINLNVNTVFDYQGIASDL